MSTITETLVYPCHTPYLSVTTHVEQNNKHLPRRWNISNAHLKDPSTTPSTLVELLRLRAQNRPEKTIYTFLGKGETETASLTYAELDRQARAIATSLQQLGAKDQRALLLYPSGLEFISAFFGCLYARTTAVPAYPPRNARHMDRIETILSDADAQIILTTGPLKEKIHAWLASRIDPNKLHLLSTDDLTGGIEEPEITVGENDLAFLQYTSGSTSAPKGVMVTHKNIMHNERMICEAFGQTETSIVLSWLPMYHDMGLIGNILQPLYIDSGCILMAPSAFLQKPLRWLAAVSHYRAEITGGPDFAYELCVNTISPEQRAKLDLSCLKIAYNGSEPIRAEGMERFIEAFTPCGLQPEALYPCYGLAEATLLVTSSKQNTPPVTKRFANADLEQGRAIEIDTDTDNTKQLVGCGRTRGNTQILIVDPQTCRPCHNNEIGEIWISGPSVAQGYWRRPEETEHAFRALLADTDEGPFLRTGDLGFSCDGELFITGRLKDLIIIRGRNHYPQDIERTVVQSHPSFRAHSTAAFSIENNGREGLVVVQEVERSAMRALNAEELAQITRRTLAETHEVGLHALILLKPGSLPKTSSGKIQRLACRRAYLNGKLDEIASWSAPPDQNEIVLESEVRTVETVEDIKRVLQEETAHMLSTSPDDIPLSENIDHLGLDSLQTFRLLTTVENVLQIDISDQTLFSEHTLSQLAHELFAKIGQDTSTTEDALKNPNNIQNNLSQRLLKKTADRLIHLIARPQIEGLEHIPPSGPLIIAANHQNILDALLFYGIFPRPVSFLVVEHWQRVPFISWFLKQAGDAIYIDRDRSDSKALKQALNVLRSGQTLLAAPEGTVSHTGGLIQGHNGLPFLAATAPAPILPLVAYGHERLSVHWRKARRAPIQIKIGAPIRLPSGPCGPEQLNTYTDYLMATLARLLPPEYRGVYAESAREENFRRLEKSIFAGAAATQLSTSFRHAKQPETSKNSIQE
ncbi:MAG: AMP-binding protein [bacterium]|nr:AMP-binding protein [bacterium]